MMEMFVMLVIVVGGYFLAKKMGYDAMSLFRTKDRPPAVNVETTETGTKTDA